MLPAGALEALRVDTRRSLADHMASSGANPDAVRAGARAIDPVIVRAFLELHIEQAPSLIEADMPVGICTAIPGNFRYPAARIRGTYDHVGLPRRFRRDAVMAGAEFALALDAMWAHHDKAGRPMACTLGRFGTDPEKHGLTSVPGELCFSLDVRAYDEAHLAEIEEQLHDIVAQVEASRDVKFELGPRAGAPVGRMDGEIQARLAHASRVLGIPALPMGSPGSHDAAAFAAAGIPTAMIFIRNANGSHNPYEAMALDDFLLGTTVLAWWLAHEACAVTTNPPTPRARR
jgi:N-carbamoyl-L-amino-acid hydrolase